MGIYIGASTKNQQHISLGNTSYGRVYVSDKLVWEKYQPEDPHAHPRWQYHTAAVKGLGTFGFNALPSGYRYASGLYATVGNQGGWWSSLEYSINNAWFRYMNYSTAEVFRHQNTKKLGMSVRPVRNYVVGDGDKIDGRILTGIFTDFNGTSYDGVIIGDQVWSTTNLKATSYLNGDPVPTGHTNSDWSNLQSGAYAIYPYFTVEDINSEQEMISIYGILYNWYAVNDPRGLFFGGQMPSDVEFTQLTDYLIGAYPEITADNVGAHLKSIKTSA